MKWNNEEKERLRQHYPHTKPIDLEPLFPGRKWQTVDRKARSMGIRKERSWTAHEQELLIYFRSFMPMRDVAVAMERSYWSVTNKYRELKGLRKPYKTK